MINAEKVYDDYLYDCYIANRQLTDEDWLYYGREEHHVEIPDRDGGLLTPCNSQYLTKYQHWIAGILQSEVLQKCCFACIPKNAIPHLEELRIKWNKSSCGEGIHHPKHRETRTNALNKGRETQMKNQIGIFNPDNVYDYTRNRPEREGPYAKDIPYAQRAVTNNSVNVSKILGKRVEIVTPDGQVLAYDSLKLACRVYRLHPGHMREVIKGKRKHHKGYTARYAD
jgi:hypothetical protein